MEQNLLIEMCGNANTSIFYGNIEKIKDKYINIYGKYPGLNPFKPKIVASNIPIQLVEQERDLLRDNKPCGMKKITIHKDIFGDECYNYVNTMMTESFNSLVTENIELKRELNSLRSKLFDLKDQDRFEQKMFADIKLRGKIRSASYFGTEYDQQQQFARGFGRSVFVPPMEQQM